MLVMCCVSVKKKLKMSEGGGQHTMLMCRHNFFLSGGGMSSTLIRRLSVWVVSFLTVHRPSAPLSADATPPTCTNSGYVPARTHTRFKGAPNLDTFCFLCVSRHAHGSRESLVVALRHRSWLLVLPLSVSHGHHLHGHEQARHVVVPGAVDLEGDAER